MDSIIFLSVEPWTSFASVEMRESIVGKREIGLFLWEVVCNGEGRNMRYWILDEIIDKTMGMTGSFLTQKSWYGILKGRLFQIKKIEIGKGQSSSQLSIIDIGHLILKTRKSMHM